VLGRIFGARRQKVTGENYITKKFIVKGKIVPGFN
jgi:hypothetical protein